MICGGISYPISTNYDETRDNQHRIVMGVPAYECNTCGVRVFDDIVVEQLEKILETGTPVRTLQSPVYNFATTTT